MRAGLDAASLRASDTSSQIHPTSAQRAWGLEPQRDVLYVCGAVQLYPADGVSDPYSHRVTFKMLISSFRNLTALGYEQCAQLSALT